MGFITWCLQSGWNILCISAGLYLFGWLAFGDGRKTIKGLIRTLPLLIELGIKKLVSKAKKEEPEPEDDDKPQKIEAHII